MIPYNKQLAEETTFEVGVIEKDGTKAWPHITYEDFVCDLIKERGDTAKNLEHMVIGICGEAGEIADAIKKHTIYGKELNIDNVVEELGDLEFYVAGLRQMLALTRYQTLHANVEKLAVRYPNGYSDAAAIARADKVESKQPAKFTKGQPQAINLPAASVEGMDDTAEVANLEAEAVAEASGLPLAEVTKALDSFEPTVDHQALQAPELDSAAPIQVFDHDNHLVDSRP